jgi:hypothetical protein
VAPLSSRDRVYVAAIDRRLSARAPATDQDEIAPVCPDIPDDEFVRLVEDVARVKLKYAAIQDFEDAGKTG